jgi:hypothetical protein
MNRPVNPKSLDELGFRTSVGSVHLSRTIMLGELSLVLDGVPPDALASRYRQAIIEENLLGKATRSTRIKTTKHLTALYALAPAFALFRLLRTFWGTKQAGKPMLAFPDPFAKSHRLPLPHACVDDSLSIR